MTIKSGSPIDKAVAKVSLRYEKKITKLNTIISELRKQRSKELKKIEHQWQMDGLIEDFIAEWQVYGQKAIALYDEMHPKYPSFINRKSLDDYEINCSELDILFSYTIFKKYVNKKGYRIASKIKTPTLDQSYIHDNKPGKCFKRIIFCEKKSYLCPTPYMNGLVDFSLPIVPRTPKEFADQLKDFHPVIRSMVFNIHHSNFTEQELFLLSMLTSTYEGRPPLIPFWEKD